MRRPPRSSLLLGAALLVLPLALLASVMTGVTATVAEAATGAAAPRPTVSGHRLLDAATGAPLRVAGVNRSGSEYACVQGWGLFDGPVDDTAITAVADWGTNAIRVPLNESCWLGLDGVRPEYAGAAYRTAITDLVDRAARHGLATILDLHWAAPGAQPATGQQIAPDADHAPAFWSSVASAFKDQPSVMFELFNEPRDISWACWRDGCTTPDGWSATGAQQLVDAVRASGARQPIILDGLNWGGDLSQWSAYAPDDPLDALVAGWHAYNFSGCRTTGCWDATVAPVAEHHPVLLTEVGEDDCATGFLEQVLPWADRHEVGYLAWSWNTASCGSGPALISDYAGTPTAFGAGYRHHLAQRSTPTPTTPTPSTPMPSTPTPTPTPTPTTPTPTPSEAPVSVPAPVAPAPSRLDRAALFDFEDGTTQGWTTRWGSVDVAPAAGPASSGTHGLSLSLDGAGYPAVGTDRGVAGLRPGGRVSYRLHLPGSAQDRVAPTVSPVLFDQSWKVTVLARHALHPGWNTVTFTVPRAVTTTRVLGLQVDDPAGWTGVLTLDRVTVARLRHTFDAAGSTAGYRVRFGRTSLRNVAAPSSDGRRALRVTLLSPGPHGIASTQVTDLLPGSVASLRVWAPRGVRATSRPLLYDGSGHPHLLGVRRLAPGWNQAQFVVPGVIPGVRSVGVRIDVASSWRGSVLLDSVAW